MFFDMPSKTEFHEFYNTVLGYIEPNTTKLLIYSDYKTVIESCDVDWWMLTLCRTLYVACGSSIKDLSYDQTILQYLVDLKQYTEFLKELYRCVPQRRLFDDAVVQMATNTVYHPLISPQKIKLMFWTGCLVGLLSGCLIAGLTIYAV